MVVLWIRCASAEKEMHWFDTYQRISDLDLYGFELVFLNHLT